MTNNPSSHWVLCKIPVMHTKDPCLFSRSKRPIHLCILRKQKQNKNVPLSFIVTLLMSVNVYVSLVPLWNYKELPAVSRHSVGEDKLARVRLMHTKCRRWEVVGLPSLNVRLEKQNAKPADLSAWHLCVCNPGRIRHQTGVGDFRTQFDLCC